MVGNDILKYNALKQYSILDYYTFMEMVNKNIAKMNDGQSKNSLRGR